METEGLRTDWFLYSIQRILYPAFAWGFDEKAWYYRKCLGTFQKLCKQWFPVVLFSELYLLCGRGA